MTEDQTTLVYSFNSVKNPKCPYTEKIEKLRYGDMIIFRGNINSNCKRFNLNLIGQLPGKRPETAFHFTTRFDHKTLVRNTTENGKWGPEEVTKGTGPLNTGGRFQILFLIMEDKFKVSINNRHYFDYKYRMPLASIKSMKIEGGIAIDSVHIQPSPENSKLMPRIAHLPPDPIKPAEEQAAKQPAERDPHIAKLPICYGYMLKVPYIGRIPGGMTKGRTIFATVIPSKASSRWTINLWTSRTSRRNLPLHFNVRHDQRSVVLNSTDADNKWQEEVIPKHFPVQCGKHTDVVIVSEQDRYVISVSNLHFVEFKHRYAKLEDIRVVTVEGDCSLVHIRVQ